MQFNKDDALVVFSGGQDSTTCLGWALNNFSGTIHCLTFDYGQKHRAEIEAARAVKDYFQTAMPLRHITHEILRFPVGMFAGASPLTDQSQPLETYSNHRSMAAIIGDRIEKTFVPMRNAAFLMIAANRAVVHGTNHIVTGVCQADNANYPDCTAPFVDSAEATINMALGLQGQMCVHTPLMNLSKAQSVHLARELPFTYAALAFSHTAYDGAYPPTGKDHASVLRAHGFEEAGYPDPLVIRAWREGLMRLPETANYEEWRATAEQERLKLTGLRQ